MAKAPSVGPGDPGWTAPGTKFTSKCPFPNCSSVFDNAESLRLHKISTASHDHCKICNADFVDSKALFDHKVKSRRHIVCEFCEEEFKSMGGRDRHIKQFHWHAQEIRCIGCDALFKRAASYMAHLEQGKCPVICKTELDVRRVQKEVVKQALDDPEKFHAENFLAAMGSTTGTSVTGASDTGIGKFKKLPSYVSDGKGSEVDHEDTDPGGVSLGRFGRDAGLVTSNMSKDFPELTKHESNIPMKPRDLNASMEELSVDNKVSSAWSSGGKSSSKELFPDAKPTPITKKFLEQVKAMEEDRVVKVSVRKNALHVQDWSPESVKFESTGFRDPETGKYVCPHPRCIEQFNDSDAFLNHLRSGTHMPDWIRCPACLKLFKTTSALIAHIESPSTRCHIKESTKFEQALDHLSGGMIEAGGKFKDGSIAYAATRGTMEAGKPTDLKPDDTFLEASDKW